MGAFLSNTAVSDVGSPGLVLQHTPKIVSENFLSDTLNWMQVSGYYKANGGEMYITIGNFNTDIASDTIHVGGFYNGSLYFIDDVTVKKIASCDTTLTVTEHSNGDMFNLFPNPSNGLFNVQMNNHADAQIKIYNVLGACVYQNNNASSNYEIDLSNQPNGIYYISINGKFLKNEKIVIIK